MPTVAAILFLVSRCQHSFPSLWLSSSSGAHIAPRRMGRVGAKDPDSSVPSLSDDIMRSRQSLRFRVPFVLVNRSCCGVRGWLFPARADNDLFDVVSSVRWVLYLWSTSRQFRPTLIWVLPLNTHLAWDKETWICPMWELALPPGNKQF